MANAAQLAEDLRNRAGSTWRYMVAIAGAPGSGKTTLAEELCEHLIKAGESAIVVPMDGFHFDDIVLNARGHRDRKGAEHTFDSRGFVHLIKRIKAREPDIAIPVFDRTMELSRAAADVVNDTTRFVLVEGLYLLLNKAPWSNLKALFDHTIYLSVPEDELVQRLTRRIMSHGHDAVFAKHWIESNDLINMRDVIENSAAADQTITF